jgi:NAD+ dependent glucose-6-phosphate dehydrogenase
VGGCRAVVHLAGNPDQRATYEELRGPNLDAAANILEAALGAGVRRLVFASSIHVSGVGRPAGPDCPVRPCCLYGASKAFGEALTRRVADEGVSAICLRIGGFVPDAAAVSELLPPAERNGAITARDLAQLVRLALDAELDFGIFYAISAWRDAVVDLTAATEVLGYRPLDGG